MATIIKENYLKALYYLDQKSSDIQASDLGKELKVSKPTVNDMVKKLETIGWVKYEKYKPLKLTDKGRVEAALVIRKHRLTEMFLVQLMGFGWEEVHDIAEEIEHINSTAFFDRMDELLGFPKSDPHGSPIPDKSGKTHNVQYQILSNIKEGRNVLLKGLRDSSKDFLLLLNKNNLSLGDEITLEQIEPFDQSITVSYKNYTNVVFSHSVASRLLVEVV